MTKYLVIDDKKFGDTFVYVKDTLEEANKCAKEDWEHLSKYDKKTSHISVGIVDESMLADDAFEEDEIDWLCYKEYDGNEECFDSDKL